LSSKQSGEWRRAGVHAAAPKLLHIYPVLFDVIFVVASVGMMTMVIDIVAAVAHGVMHTFIAPVPVVAVMMHTDAHAVWADHHGICHGACRKVRNAQGYKE
jgi:hypothetical protein